MVNGHQHRSHSWTARHPPTPERSSLPDPRPFSQRSFHGVRRRSWGRWVSEIRIPNSRDKIWLGSYATPEQAARAYDVASILLCRPFPLNFSDSPSLLHLPHLSAASSLPSRRSIQATAQLAALSAPVNCLPPAHEVASTGCASLVPPYCNLGPTRADLNSTAYLQEDSSWMEELRSLLLAPEEPDTMNSLTSTSNIGAAASLSIHGVFDAAAINLSFDATGSYFCAAAGGELQEEVLMDEEYEEALQEMLAVDGFTATSVAVTTRQRIDVDDDADIAPLWTLP